MVSPSKREGHVCSWSEREERERTSSSCSGKEGCGILATTARLERREAWSAGPGAFACVRSRVNARASRAPLSRNTPAAPIEQLPPTLDVLGASRLPTRRLLRG